MAFDINRMLIPGTADVTADVTGDALDVFGGDMVERYYRAIVPEAGGTTPTLDITIEDSEDGTNWHTLVVFPQITAAGQYIAHARSKARYRRALLDVGGTSPDFGAVLIGMTASGEGLDW